MLNALILSRYRGEAKGSALEGTAAPVFRLCLDVQ